MDLYSDLGLENSDHDMGEMLLDFSDVLYSDVNISTMSRLSPTLTEDTYKLEGFMSPVPVSPLKSPWSDSDSGVSDTGLLSDYYNEASPIIENGSSNSELHHVNNQRVNQGWLLENNNSVNSSNYTSKLSLNVDNQYLMEKELDISNYTNSVNSTEERKGNKVSTLLAGILPIKIINRATSTFNSNILETTHTSTAKNSFHCPEKENKLHTISSNSSAPKQEKPRTVSPCENMLNDDKSRKNALQAKLNREKKKAYMKGLEEELTTLKNQNQDLKSENDTFKLKNAELETEVDYLKSVLANSSALSALLKNIGHTNGLKLSSTITNRKRKLESVTTIKPDTFEDRAKKPFTAGVCLHVSDSHASLELCAHCSSMAEMSYES